MVAYENREPFQFGNIVQDSRRSRRRQSAIDGGSQRGLKQGKFGRPVLAAAERAPLVARLVRNWKAPRRFLVPRTRPARMSSVKLRAREASRSGRTLHDTCRIPPIDAVLAWRGRQTPVSRREYRKRHISSTPRPQRIPPAGSNSSPVLKNSISLRPSAPNRIRRPSSHCEYAMVQVRQRRCK